MRTFDFFADVMSLVFRAASSAAILLAASAAIAPARADAPPLAWSTSSLTLDPKSANACAPTVIEKFVRYAVVPVAVEPVKRHALIVQRFEVGSGCFEGYRPARASVYAKAVDVRTGRIGDKPLWSFDTEGIAGEIVPYPAAGLYRIDMPGCCGAAKTEKYFSLRTGKLVASSTSSLLSLESTKDRELRYAAVEDGIAASPQGVAGAMATVFFGDADGVRETLAIASETDAGRHGWSVAELSWKGQEVSAKHLALADFSGASLQLRLDCLCDAEAVQIEIPITGAGLDEANARVSGMSGIVLTKTARGAAPRSTLARGQARPSSAEATVQAFFDYLLRPRTNIATDAAAQKTWLAADLRKQLIEATAAVKAARKSPEADGPDPALPDNGVFLDSWDYPTTCGASAGQAPAGRTQAQIEVECEWGRRTNYPGATRTASVALIMEDGVWRIADVRMHKSRYATEVDLVNELASLKSQAEGLSRPPGEPR